MGTCAACQTPEGDICHCLLSTEACHTLKPDIHYGLKPNAACLR